MLSARNASSSILKQNDCKNKATWLNQAALSKSISLCHTVYIEKNFLKDYFFVQNLFYFKRFSKDIVFKLSKIVELKIVKLPEDMIACGMKDRK